jgi:hypothetical protein
VRRNVRYERDVARAAGSIAPLDLEADDPARAPPFRSLARGEGLTVDREPLAVVRHDEPLILRLVEPEHLSSHRASFR